jgi:molecular chaperone Hsp33
MNELKKKYQHRDRVVRAITSNGLFRAAAANTTHTIGVAAQKHSLDEMQAFLLGRTITAAALLSSFLKGEERVIVQAEGEGRLRMVYAEAMQVGEVRGFVQINKNRPLPETLTEVLGKGFFKVTRVLYEKREPVTGIVHLVKGDISSDLAYYFEQSEQIVTSVNLGVNIDDNSVVRHAGGLIVQAMPGAGLSDIVEVQRSLEELPPVEELLEDGYSPEEILRQAMPFPIEIVNNTPLDFYCRCSLERFMSKLITLGPQEIRSMQEAGQNELVCQYCSEHYYLQPSDFDAMLRQLEQE